MTEQITQKLGFDASQAISTINTLNTSFASLNANLNTLAQSANAFNRTNLSKSLNGISKTNVAATLNNASNAANKFGTNARTASKNAADGMNNVKNSVNGAVISWQTLSRIILAQTVVRGINAIKSSTTAAITEVRDLQKRISEIQTIADGGLGSNADIFSSLQVTSETFGLDILDVAEAKYQELSNQVEGSAESQQFFNNAAKFSIATNSSLTDSVNLLSSALNAYELSATQSAEISGILFTTIKEGRVRASELASSLGRVLPLAKSLGIGLDEVAASLVKITQGGTRADTGLTQILGVINKLAKPTPALAEAFEQLGVASAQEGIQRSGGLLQFLVRLKEEAGDNQALVGFFNNVRAIQGLLSLVGSESSKTADIFDTLGVSRSELTKVFEEAATVGADNDARRQDQAYQELQGTFRNLATKLIPLLTSGLEYLNSIINSVAQNPLITGVILTTGAVALGIYAVGVVGLTSAVTALGLAALKVGVLLAGPVGLGFAAVATGIVLTTRAYKKNTEAAYEYINTEIDKVAKDHSIALRDFNSELRNTSDEFKRGNRAITNYLNEFLEIEKEAKSATVALEGLQEAQIGGSLDGVLSARKAISKEIQDTVKNADKEIEKSAERRTKFIDQKESFLLDRQLGNLNELQQAYKLSQISREKAAEALTKIEDSNNLDDFERAADLLSKRVDIANKGLEAANSSGNRAAIYRAEQDIVTALNDQIALEERRSEVIEERRSKAEAEAARDLAEVKLLTKNIKEIEKLLAITNNGSILNPKQLENNRERVAELIQELRGQSLSGETLDLSKFLGITEIADKFEARLQQSANFIEKKRQEIPSKLEEIFSDVNAQVDDRVIEIAIDLGLTEGGVNEIDVLNKSISKAAEELKGLEDSQTEVNKATQTLAAEGKVLDGVFKDIKFTGKDPEGQKKIFDDFLSKVKSGELDVTKFNSALVKLNNSSLGFLGVGSAVDLVPGADSVAIDKLADSYVKILAARKNLDQVNRDNSADLLRVEALKSFQKSARATLLTLSQTPTEIGKIGSSTNNAKLQSQQLELAWKSVSGTINDAKEAVEAYSKAVQNAPSPPSGGGTPRMFGGMTYRASGGVVRGTDSIPAMLSPNEFVINAKSSRQFASQLNSINSGSNPVFRQEGGPTVSNTVNVGDINVNGGPTSDDTARKVVSQIKREFRRGTSQF